MTTAITVPLHTIPLSQGKEAIVSPEDYDYLMQWRWSYKSGCCGYALRRKRKNEEDRAQTVYMHREIAKRIGLEVDNYYCIDHKNRNGIDNRRENLRLATAEENTRNVGPYPGHKKKFSSRFKGVSFKRKSQKWVSYIGGLHLGCFNNEEEAARAYDEAAKKKYGEFAFLNFPENEPIIY